MKQIFSLLTLFTVLTFSLAAQSVTGRITGVIKSEEGKSLEAATVTVLKAKDSSLVKAALSNKSGEFVIEKIPPGKYLVSVTSVGYHTFFSSAFEISENKYVINLASLQLKAESKSLGPVQVTARRPLIENKIDKTVVNVEAAVTNVGTNALEVLEKSPGITVDKDGNISLKGKQGVIVLLDGKQTYLSGEDLANLLRNMPSNQLDQIEIMSQPSAKFDASGNSGVINIKTKRNNLKGFNGSVSVGYTQGVYPKSSSSFNINSRKGKLNVFANYNYSYWKGFNELSIYRNFRNQSTKDLDAVFDQSSYRTFEGQPHSLKLGMDFFATKKTTVGFVLNGTYNDRKSTGFSSTNILNGLYVLDSINKAETRNKEPWLNYSANLNLRHVFDSSGKEITADLDYVRYYAKSKQMANNYTYTPAGDQVGDPYLLRGKLPSDINIFTAKVDYAHPLKKQAKLEAGLKTSYVKTDNDAQYTFWDAPIGKWSNDPKSNHFMYTENVNAAYINASKQIKKWGFQVGLRLENTNSKGKQVTTGEVFNRNYTQLFPTTYISYALNASNNFGLSYGRRIERPNYQDLNPFKYFLDQYTYGQGNPYLTPQFSHNIELSHNYKGQLNTSLNFTQTTDIINDILEQNDTSRITYQTKKNIASRRNIGLSISYNKPLTKYWTLNFYTNAYNSYFSGVINNKKLRVDYSSFMFNMSNQFKFNKGWGAEVSGFYRYKTLEGATILSEPMGVFSFGVSKQVLKNKGSVKLNIRDPFYLQQFKGSTKFDNIDVDIRSRWDNRQVSLNFTYRFGKNENLVPQRRRTGASQDEQNRVGNGQ